MVEMSLNASLIEYGETFVFMFEGVLICHIRA